MLFTKHKHCAKLSKKEEQMEAKKSKDNLKEEDKKIPNDITLEAMKDVETGENYEDVTLEKLSK